MTKLNLEEKESENEIDEETDEDLKKMMLKDLEDKKIKNKKYIRELER